MPGTKCQTEQENGIMEQWNVGIMGKSWNNGTME
jgi:hypothetical protein